MSSFTHDDYDTKLLQQRIDTLEAQLTSITTNISSGIPDYENGTVIYTLGSDVSQSISIPANGYILLGVHIAADSVTYVYVNDDEDTIIGAVSNPNTSTDVVGYMTLRVRADDTLTTTYANISYAVFYPDKSLS